MERAEGEVIELASGCLCCTVRSDLGETMVRLVEQCDGRDRAVRPRDHRDDRLADPAPILHTLMTDPFLLHRFRLEGLVTVVDAFNGAATLDEHEEAVKQVAVADRIVLTKADLMVWGAKARENLHAIVRRLRKLNPTARMLDTHSGEPSGPPLQHGSTIRRRNRWMSAGGFRDAFEGRDGAAPVIITRPRSRARRWRGIRARNGVSPRPGDPFVRHRHRAGDLAAGARDVSRPAASFHGKKPVA